MKTMTCKELGGACDQKLSANTWDEMVKTMTKHVLEKHPDVAKKMEKMHNEDPKTMGKGNAAEVGRRPGDLTAASLRTCQRRGHRLVACALAKRRADR